MEQLVYRRNKLFVIDKSKLKPEAKSDNVCNALYAAIYSEFVGASTNPKYKGLNLKEMMEKLNEFSWDWLKQRGLA